MDDRDQALRQRLLLIFEEEAREHVQELSDQILRLEKNATGEAGERALETAFRAAHSLKGAARVVNRSEIEELCESLESVFFDLKKKAWVPSSETFDALLGAAGELETLIANPASKQAADLDRCQSIILALSRMRHRAAAAAVPQESVREEHAAFRTAREVGGTDQAMRVSEEKPNPGGRTGTGENVRVSIAKLEAIRHQAEDLFAQKLSAVEQVQALKTLGAALNRWRKQPTKDLAFLDEVEVRVRGIYREARRHRNSLSAKLDRLLDDSREVAMVPCESLGAGLERLVRDLAQELGKEVAFTMTGGEIQIDRYIINELRDPVFHMVRNALDHGLETPGEREAGGKPRRGHVRLAVRHLPGDRVELSVEDDGRGIDVSRLRETLASAGQDSATAVPSMDDATLIDQVFRSAVTTRATASGISGRGLGLAIVREKAEKLGGSARIDSQSGRGMRLLITLPLSLATVRGIVVRVDGARFVIPTADVQRALSVRREEAFPPGQTGTAKFGEDSINCVLLRDALRLNKPRAYSNLPERLPGLIVQQNHRRLLMLVDAVEREFEFLVKPIGIPFLKLGMVTGATVLGTGTVAPILNVGAVIDEVMQNRAGNDPAASAADVRSGSKRPSILLVEDSETSRAWLKSIVEAAGYTVETAVDGMDAWRKLQQGAFQLVVSDIDMPRLNGIHLTGRIRGLARLQSVPVILVTSLDAPEHRRGGMKAGANAVLVKGSAGRDDLLTTIRRLL